MAELAGPMTPCYIPAVPNSVYPEQLLCVILLSYDITMLTLLYSQAEYSCSELFTGIPRPPATNYYYSLNFSTAPEEP